MNPMTAKDVRQRVALHGEMTRQHAAFLERALLPPLLDGLVERFRDYNNQTQEETE